VGTDRVDRILELIDEGLLESEGQKTTEPMLISDLAPTRQSSVARCERISYEECRRRYAALDPEGEEIRGAEVDYLVVDECAEAPSVADYAAVQADLNRRVWGSTDGSVQHDQRFQPHEPLWMRVYHRDVIRCEHCDFELGWHTLLRLARPVIELVYGVADAEYVHRWIAHNEHRRYVESQSG
jgi:hypothetical protein